MYVKLTFLNKGLRIPRCCTGSGIKLFGSLCSMRSLHKNSFAFRDNYSDKDHQGGNISNNKGEQLDDLFNGFKKKGASRKYLDSHLGHRINKEHYGKHIHQLDDKRLKRGHTEFRVSNGTEQAQNAVRHLIRKVHACSPHYKVKFVDPQTGKLEQGNLASIINNMNFHEQGLYMVSSATNNDFPLVKINKTHEMIKMYSDDLAAQREKELLSRGSIAAQKALRQRDRAEKKKSAAKVLTLSWNIGLGDLAKQKKDEIERRLAKGDRLTIEVGTRKQVAKFNFDQVNAQNEENAEDKDVDDHTHSDYDFEMRRREMIIEKICEISEESNCSFEKHGSIKSRVTVNCTPRMSPQSTKTDDAADTSQRESRSQKKMRTKQKQKEEENSQSKKEESDLDSMYNFKIED